ncbi:MAG: hypothetical protein CMI08_05015 [Oceanospirillaceae bacterium]|uniref:hypothetical protein n=1 Tax=unclassified Thalassolituus TaxID=2624967 RepID=UPI000C0A5D3D|nr:MULTISPECIES: hypothetical protein [unclassified Thalassolituus]MAK90828.1 hypothetical protein [Thalassolituus sp.]MAS25017.1 hypothetical protein [Oceanospirillaceae bacterium]MAX98559.1 hypothetical protein [Oceanospirillaceae bacterium]MBL35460.1 hypothetical protein [Oceanospirillaceae bacterium]MBS51857.1 hypothetical protein [Oceanospirillaceae bacterium]|tara:strand:- start:32 stop:547 length:516 start_codon:yes stop_codon:yes gene_type:complete
MRILLLIVLGMLAGCSESPSDSYLNTPGFNIRIPHDVASGGHFFAAGDLSVAVKSPSGGVLMAMSVSRLLENLDSDFILADYPRYALGLKQTDNLKDADRLRFDQSRSVYEATYDLSHVRQQSSPGKESYSVCNETECLAFIVKDDVAEHILMLSSTNIRQESFSRIAGDI